MTDLIEPPVKIVMLRVTSDDPDLPMEEFTDSLRALLDNQGYTKNVNVMTQQFLVDGVTMQKDTWYVAQERKEDLSTLNEEEIIARLDAMDERITAARSGAEDRNEMMPEITRYAFLLSKFAESDKIDVRFRDRALSLHAQAMGWITGDDRG